MVLLGVGGREITQRGVVVRGISHQEMEMKMKNDNLSVRKEREIEKGIVHQEMEDDGGSDEEDMGGRENGIRNEFVGAGDINDKVGGYNKDMPPVDDVCPICFDRFTIPCRSNCGHWFCASCILQFWMFKSSFQPCKCPLCCCRIVNLKPDTSPPADESVEVLKKVHQYNSLYVSGMIGVFHRLLALPLFMRRVFGVLIDPDGLRCIYYGLRILGLVLALLYEKWEFEFVPTGGLGIQRTFDMCASVLILTLFSVGLGYRFMLRGRVRRMQWDDI